MARTNDAPRLRMARPARVNCSLWDDAAGTPLELSSRPTWPLGVGLALMFALFAGVLWAQVASLRGRPGVDSVFDLTTFLLQGFWILGWSVGVVILGALAVLFLVYGESARLHRRRLIRVTRLSPLKVISEYDLAQVKSVYLEPSGGNGNVRVRFLYGPGRAGLGDAMPRDAAQRLAGQVRAAVAAVAAAPASESAAEPIQASVPPARILPPPTSARGPLSLASASAVALIAANLVALAGVAFGRWGLGEVMVLFWAESLVIGFYTVLKIVVVGRLGALFAVPFFLGHYGAFMAVHFLFVYYFFVRGLDAESPEPGVREALRDLLVPLWPALAALFVSHGISFAQNFIRRREYAGLSVTALMAAPYKRIVIMHLTVIFGGWLVMALHSALPALVLLILLKAGTDLRAHRREHPLPAPVR